MTGYKMKKIEPGNLIELKSSCGFLYALCTHIHERYGPLMRVMTIIYSDPQINFADIVKDRVSLTVFMPVNRSIQLKLTKIVGKVNVPDNLKPFPMFKAGFPSKDGKSYDSWWLWDGRREWRIEDLTDEQRKYPLRCIITIPYIVDMIEKGWPPDEAALNRM